VAIWLDQGKIVETGSPETLLPKFIDEMNRIEVL
jgi:ABC-type polysaccharide/polyol phosphate transport system ATPase subunit